MSDRMDNQPLISSVSLSLPLLITYPFAGVFISVKSCYNQYHIFVMVNILRCTISCL